MLALQAVHSADWLYELPVSSLGLYDWMMKPSASPLEFALVNARDMLVLAEPLSTQREHMVCLVAGVQADSSGRIS